MTITWVDISFFILCQPYSLCVYVYIFLSEEQTEGILYILDLMALRESKWELDRILRESHSDLLPKPHRPFVTPNPPQCSRAAFPARGRGGGTLGSKRLMKDTCLESPEHSFYSPRKFYLKLPLFILLS